MNKEVKPLKDLLDSVRNIEGFPIGKDEDILALSNPPYYTACPNPYLNDFIAENGKPYDEATDTYQREPFVGDISEGKKNKIYNLHSYHTKVPFKAIIPYISHYTTKGDIVLDAFAGTGMTALAAINKDRKAIVSDLSPIASFISNGTVTLSDFKDTYLSIIKKVEDECSDLYTTIDPEDNSECKISFIVWSELFYCKYCNNEYNFFQQAVDLETGSVLAEYYCPHCGAKISKASSSRVTYEYFDKTLNKSLTKAEQVLIVYIKDGKTYEKEPDENDIQKYNMILAMDIPYWYPVYPMMFKGEKWGDSWRAGYHLGITHTHHFYTQRTLYVLSCLWRHINQIKEIPIRNQLKYAFTASITGLSILQRYRYNSHFPNMILSGTLYVGSLRREWNAIEWFKGKCKSILSSLSEIPLSSKKNMVLVSTQSAIDLKNIKANSIDYVFTDPPFGDNLLYSELNFIWESWLKCQTSNTTEAIINSSQNKALTEYHKLILLSFCEYFRVLKPNRWITVVFHNSKSSVWNSIQDAILKAGFVIAQVSILNKEQGSYKQITSPGAVKNDLVISAYKPRGSFQRKFLELAGEGMEEEFIRMHLSHLSTEPSIERTEQMLYSKLLAFYVRHSYTVKYDASTFYKMLRREFAEEDGFWFLPEQLPAYREYKQKMKLEGIAEIASGQFTLFVADEKSALIWLNAFLTEPKDFQTIHPAFTKVAAVSGDAMPDLKDLLQDNFVLEDGKYRRPQSEDEKQSITAKRERVLLREFEELLLEAKATKKKIKECRKQVVLYGFEHCYKQERFADILALARKLDKSILENDVELNDFVEVAQMKVEGV
jgi:DNA modification methylase